VKLQFSDPQGRPQYIVGTGGRGGACIAAEASRCREKLGLPPISLAVTWQGPTAHTGGTGGLGRSAGKAVGGAWRGGRAHAFINRLPLVF